MLCLHSLLVPGAAPVVSASPDQRSINLSWMMLECQDRRGNITMYEVRYTSIAFGDNVNRTLNTSSGDELNLEVDGLEEFTNYTIEVRAYTAIGPSPYSDPMNVRTLPDSKRSHILYIYACMYARKHYSCASAVIYFVCVFCLFMCYIYE